MGNLTEKEIKKIRRRREKRIKKFLYIVSGILILGGGILGLGRLLANQPARPESKIVARNGLHWHADLSIKISGEYQETPANIGLGLTERPVHTHDTDGVIHMEFLGLVKEDDIRLGRFFEIWGKKFNKDCIFDKCSGGEGRLKMLVDGEENLEFENYAMKDGNKIEIILE